MSLFKIVDLVAFHIIIITFDRMSEFLLILFIMEKHFDFVWAALDMNELFTSNMKNQVFFLHRISENVEIQF